MTGTLNWAGSLYVWGAQTGGLLLAKQPETKTVAPQLVMVSQKSQPDSLHLKAKSCYNWLKAVTAAVNKQGSVGDI